jgi:hypothetical protein
MTITNWEVGAFTTSSNKSSLFTGKLSNSAKSKDCSKGFKVDTIAMCSDLTVWHGDLQKVGKKGNRNEGSMPDPKWWVCVL